ncbi:hypothetical protein Tco_1491540 [Tanacetum coccineum]
MSLANQKATTEYQEAIQATEDLESPANSLKKSQRNDFQKTKHPHRSSYANPTELPTQEDQIRGYRQMARNRHQVARTTRRVFGRNNYNRTLETAVDPERQLEISRERRESLTLAYPLEDLHDKDYTQSTGGKRSLDELRRNEMASNDTCSKPLVRVHSRVAVNDKANVRLSLRFERYRQTPQPPRYSVDQHDREVIGNDNLDEDEEHFIIPEEEPLNKLGIQQPKRSKAKVKLRNGQLGEHGKMGLSMSDDEVTPGKVTILEESDWDDDERSGGEILVIQERLAQNQQEFLDISKEENDDDDLRTP